MNIMQTAVIGAAVFTMGWTTMALAANSKVALDHCKTAIEARYDAPVRHTHEPGAAMSTQGEKFTLWINSIATEDTSTERFRSLCVTSKSGEVVALDIEPGRW